MMGYRDDLIQQLRESGIWETMTSERRGLIERFDDQTARGVLVLFDENEIELAGRRNALSVPGSSSKEDATKFLHKGLTNLTEVFNGELVPRIEEGGSAPSGLLKAFWGFMQEAERSGFSLQDIERDLSQINQEAFILLDMLRRKSNNDI